jgi:hypothetical protein
MRGGDSESHQQSGKQRCEQARARRLADRGIAVTQHAGDFGACCHRVVAISVVTSGAGPVPKNPCSGPGL